MLQLLKPPENDVAAILQAALEHAHLSIPSPRFWSRTTYLKRHFTRCTAMKATQDLLVASKRPERYELAAAHWLLLHDALDLYCEDHNMSPEVDPYADPWPAGDPDSRPIPFDSIRAEYLVHPSVPRAGSHVRATDLKLVPSDGATRQAKISRQRSASATPSSSRRKRHPDVRLSA